MAHACLRFSHLGSYSPSRHKLHSWLLVASSVSSKGRGRRWRLPVPGCRPPLVCSRKTSKKWRANAKWAGASNGLPGMAHRSIDQIDSCLERGVYIQIRGVEQDCVFGAFERRCGAAFIALVAALDVGQHFGFGNGNAGTFQLAITPPRPLLCARRHKQLHIGVGANHCADIAAVEHRARFTPREGALVIAKRLSHLGLTCNDRGRFTEAPVDQRGIIQRLEIELLRRTEGGCRIRWTCSPCQRVARNGAVELAGVEMSKRIMGGDALAERTLPRGCRSVDGDDHAQPLIENSAPSFVISFAKSGKLVAIMLASSTVTGSRAARPSVRKAMAMR